MKESKIRGVVVGLSSTDTWNTHQLRWFRVTLKADIEDMADDRKVTPTNMDILIDDPAHLPQLGDLVILTVQIVPLDTEAPEPPPQYGDEVALADPEEDPGPWAPSREDDDSMTELDPTEVTHLEEEADRG